MKLEDFHSWQIEAIKKAKEKDYRATIEAPTGSGKTRVAFGIRDCCLKHGEKTLVIVPAICLMEQWLIELRKVYPELYIKQYDKTKTYYDIAVSVIDSVRNEILDPDIKLIIFDECLEKQSKIMLPNFGTETIKNIVEKQEIKEVLSYNEEKKIFEPKRILRYIKQPIAENWYEINIESASGTKYKLKCTGNHKIWTLRGYKCAKDLSSNDILKVYELTSKHICKVCGSSFKSRESMAGHLGSCIKREIKCDKCNIQIKCGAAYGMHSLHHKLKDDPIFRQKFFEKRSKTFLKTIAKSEARKKSYLLLKERTGNKNPMHRSRHDDVFWQKYRENKRKWFNSLPKEKQNHQIKRFMEAPRYRWSKEPTKLEKFLIDMKIPELIYTGKSQKHSISFENGKRKIPDFTIAEQKKVIEVGDTTYWHSEAEMAEVVLNYKKVGYDCLYLGTSSFSDLSVLRQIVEKFSRNHNARVISIREIKKSMNVFKNKPVYKYNLEIENNHNYVANGILISNCHHYGAPTSWAFIERNQKNRFLIGLSATLERSDGNETLIERYMPVCYSSSISDAVSYGIIHDYDLKKIPVYLTESQRLEYDSLCALIRTGIKFFGSDVIARQSIRSFDHHTRKIAIDYMRALTVRKKFLSNLVQKAEATCSVLETSNTGQTLIFTQTIETTSRVATLLEKKGIKAGVYHSKIKQKTRKETLKQFKEGSLKYLAAPRALDEGIDISNAETAVITAGNAISRQFVQRIGRILRKSAGKLPKVYYIYAVGTRDEQIMNELVRKIGKG